MVDNSVKSNDETKTTAVNTSATNKPGTIVKKKVSEIGTPSIAQALSGNIPNEKKEEVVIHKKYITDKKQEDQAFTEKDLHSVWPELIGKYHDQVHLYNSLDTTPELLEDNVVKVSVENSVLQDKVRFIKPEIIGFLRRSLKNSTIDVKVELIKASSDSKVLTDEQKMKAMMQKNPAFSLLKNKFNLDFNG